MGSKFNIKSRFKILGYLPERFKRSVLKLNKKVRTISDKNNSCTKQHNVQLLKPTPFNTKEKERLESLKKTKSYLEDQLNQYLLNDLNHVTIKSRFSDKSIKRRFFLLLLHVKRQNYLIRMKNLLYLLFFLMLVSFHGNVVSLVGDTLLTNAPDFIPCFVISSKIKVMALSVTIFYVCMHSCVIHVMLLTVFDKIQFPGHPVSNNIFLINLRMHFVSMSWKGSVYFSLSILVFVFVKEIGKKLLRNILSSVAIFCNGLFIWTPSPLLESNKILFEFTKTIYIALITLLNNLLHSLGILRLWYFLLLTRSRLEFLTTTLLKNELACTPSLSWYRQLLEDAKMLMTH